MEISEKELIRLLDDTNGKFFTVWFRKKNGDVRKMVCRTGVRKYVKGVGRSYDPKAMGLFPVYEMNGGGYKQFYLNSVLRVKFGGIVYNVQR